MRSKAVYARRDSLRSATKVDDRGIRRARGSRFFFDVRLLWRSPLFNHSSYNREIVASFVAAIIFTSVQLFYGAAILVIHLAIKKYSAPVVNIARIKIGRGRSDFVFCFIFSRLLGILGKLLSE